MLSWLNELYSRWVESEKDCTHGMTVDGRIGADIDWVSLEFGNPRGICSRCSKRFGRWDNV